MAGSSFEMSLSQLADAQINQDAPSLSNSKVGFQLIDKNDDDTRGVGVMVFKVGKQWIYVPIFYLNGQIKGTDLMYLQQQAVFCPCKENWLTFFKSRQSSPLASVSDVDEKSKAERGRPGAVNILGPETRIIKTASLLDDKQVRPMFELDGEKNQFDLKMWLPRLGKEACVKFLYALNHSAEFSNNILRFYTPEDIGMMVKAAADKIDENAKPAETGGLQILTVDMPEAAHLDEEQKKSLIKDKIYIIDDRKETSTVFKNKVQHKGLNTPTATGYYHILMPDGGYKEFYVFMPASATDSGSGLNPRLHPLDTIWRSDTIVLLEPGKDKAVRAYDRNILGAKLPEPKPLSEVGKPISSMKEAATGYKDYVIFDSKGNSKIFTPSGDGWVGNVLRGHLKGREHPMLLKLTEHDGVLYRAADTMFVPKNARCIELGYDTLYTGSLSALSAYLKDKGVIKPLKVYSDGMEVTISGDDYTTGPISKTAAIRELVIKHVIGAETAKHMVKEAMSSRKPHADRYMIKYAFNTPAQLDSSAMNPAPNEQSDTIVGANQSGGDIKSLEDASNAGQKDVMDVSVLKQLATGSNTLDKINEYLPDLIKGMDRIGRLMFLYYWNNEDFKERYGQDEMTDLEDSLREVFKSLSDLVLFLHKKSVSPNSVLETTAGDLSEGIGV